MVAAAIARVSSFTSMLKRISFGTSSSNNTTNENDKNDINVTAVKVVKPKGILKDTEKKKSKRHVRFNSHVAVYDLPEDDATHAWMSRFGPYGQAPIHDELWCGFQKQMRPKELTKAELKQLLRDVKIQKALPSSFFALYVKYRRRQERRKRENIEKERKNSVPFAIPIDQDELKVLMADENYHDDEDDHEDAEERDSLSKYIEQYRSYMDDLAKLDGLSAKNKNNVKQMIEVTTVLQDLMAGAWYTINSWTGLETSE